MAIPPHKNNWLERWWECIENNNDCLIIPSCSSLLDCFNDTYTHTSKYNSESLYRLEGEINTPIIISLFSYIYINHFTATAPATWTFKTSGYKQYIGYKQGGKSKDLFGQLTQLSTLKYFYDCMPQGKAVSVELNDTKTFMTVHSKYFEDLYTAMKAVSGTYNRYGHKTAKGKSAYSSMVKTSILKERTIGAVEIVFELCRLTERRGPLKEDEYAHIAMHTLLERCPSLHTRIRNMNKKEGKRIFRMALTKAFELLKLHTSIYDTFEDLHFEIPENIVPTRECQLKIYYKNRIIKEDIECPFFKQ